jgi:hypothetical protein
MKYETKMIDDVIEDVSVKNELVRDKLLSDLEKFFREYSVRETVSGLLISTKL